MKNSFYVLILTIILIFNPVKTTVLAAENSSQVLSSPLADYFIVDSFHEGLARVEKDGKCGFIDETGKLVIPLKYDADRWDSYFSDGLALVYVGGSYIEASQRIMEGGKCGFIDRSGKIVIPLKYDRATTFSNGLAVAEKDNKQYLIDKRGKKVAALSKYYDYIGQFSEGLAIVEIENRSNRTELGFGFIDNTGKEVVALGNHELVGRQFSEGLIEVGKYDPKKRHNVYGFMNKTGKIVIPMTYAYVSSFENGMAIVQQVGSISYGVINKSGKVVIPFGYEHLMPFSNKLFCVMKDNKWGVVNLNNEIVIPIEYDSIGILSEGLASFSKDGKHGYLDEKGQVAISLTGNYEQAYFAGEALSPFRGGYAAVYSQTDVSGSVMDMATYAKWGVIDKTGKFVVPLEYDFISEISEGNAIAFKGRADFYHYSFNGEWSILHIY
ncbi:MAG: WG repeat-containing protein [Clostridiales bacterium]|nr:WG repeat-containing protein [Clostridiales bacterium]